MFKSGADSSVSSISTAVLVCLLSELSEDTPLVSLGDEIAQAVRRTRRTDVRVTVVRIDNQVRAATVRIGAQRPFTIRMEKRDGIWQRDERPGLGFSRIVDMFG